MPPKRQQPLPPKGGPRPPRGGELDYLAQHLGVSNSFAEVAHSNTRESRDSRQLLREAHKKGLKPEVLEAIAKAGATGPPKKA
jgi:hypothetical protein